MKEVSDNFETSMSIPLDSDGFLRRECPTCERELKWKYLDEEGGEEAAEPEEGGYYCPYCAIPAPPANWLTKAQAEKATSGRTLMSLGVRWSACTAPEGLFQSASRVTSRSLPTS
jgi:hypothetical protein